MPETGNVNLNANDSKAYHDIGAQYFDANGAMFFYAQFDNGSGNVTAVAGQPIGWLGSMPGGKVTNDFSDSHVNQVTGIMQRVMTDQYYGWFQARGKGVKGLTLAAGTSTDGQKLVWSGDGTVSAMTDPGNEEAVFATTTAASTLTAIAAGNYFLHVLGI